MAVTKTIHKSFAGGEVSPQMFGRIDDTKFQAGLETCHNFISQPQGGIERRPGFEFVREVKDSSKRVRLIPFVFNNQQTLVVELGDKYARFHTQGATVLNANGGVYEIATPWEEPDLFDLHYVQSADVMTIVHPRYAPRELRRYSMNDWRIVQCEFGAKLATPGNVKAVRKTSAADDKNEDKYTFMYKVSALSADKSEESKASVAVSVVANLYSYGTTAEISCDKVAGAAFYRFYKNSGGVYGFIGDSESPSIVDDNIAPNMDVTPRYYDSVFDDPGGIQSATVTAGGSGYLNQACVGDFVGGITPIRTVSLSSLNDSTGTTINPTADDLTWSESAVYSNRPWSLTSEAGEESSWYPDYPLIDEAKINSDFIKVIDAQLLGSDARVEGIFTTEYKRWKHTYRDDYRYYSQTIKRLVGFRVVNRGANYKEPQIQVTFDQINGRSDTHTYRRAWFSLPVIDSSVTLDVQDSTGHGAILSAIVSGGKLTGVRVEQAGTGYTSPKVIVRASQGSGASVSLQVGQVGNYPTAVGYFEQRRCFAGLTNDPQRVIMTRSSTESDLSYSLPVQDDDRISVQISSREFNQIRHVIPLAQLLLLTSGSEMRVSPLNSDAITPTSFSVRPQSYVGASNVQPCLVNTTVVYPAARGGHVLELGYSYTAGGYVSGDLCLRSAHLFDYRTIKDMTFAKSPTPILWFISSDGGLLGLTYIPEQSIGAWHRHSTDGCFESVAAVSEGDEDRLYAVVRRTINGRSVRYVERMAKRSFGTISEAFFVDSGGTYTGDAVTTVSGLDWLEGKTVQILGDGAVRPEQVVTNGKITLDAPASVIHVGLPYTSDAKTLPAILQADDFGQGRQKNVSMVTVRVYKSSGIYVGASFDDLVEHKQRTTETPGTPPELVSGDIQVRPFTKWTDSGSICVRQADPLPLTLLSAVLEISV